MFLTKVLSLTHNLQNATAKLFSILIFTSLFGTVLSKMSHSSSINASYEDTIDINFNGDLSKSDVHAHDKVVVCYLGTWATYRPGDGAYDLLKHFDPQLCTHLIYSFAGLDGATNKIKSLDPFLDLEEDYGKGWFKKATSLKSRYPHLKVLLAVGGWNEGSLKYSNMVSDPISMKSFITSASEIVRKHGFDGIDLDWEFPASRDGRPEDKKHFTNLVKSLRHEFDKYGLMISAAFSAAESIASNAYELSTLSNILDQIHIMCYDYHGSWDSLTYHNAPLASSIGTLHIQHSVDYFIKEGVDPKKLVLGLPLYGRTFNINENGNGSGILEKAEAKGFQGPYTREDGFLGYNEILQILASNRGDWKTYWDPIAQVPFMRNGAKWVSFDNPKSLMKKVEFAQLRNLKGAMVWSIDTDDFLGTYATSKYPLLRSINYALAQKSTEEDESNNAIEDDDVKYKKGGQGAIFPLFSLIGSLLIISLF